MSTYYWVNRGAGNWSTANNWSTSSTGTYPGNAPRYPGASGNADIAIFNATPTSASNCTVDINASVQTLNYSLYLGTLTFVSGNTITLTSTGTIFTGGTNTTIVRTGASITGDNIVTAATTTATKTITTNFATEANALNFNIPSSSNGSYVLGSSVFGNLTSNRSFTCAGGVTVYGNLNVLGAVTITGAITMAPGLSVAATAMVAGTTYTIKSTGTTNFTSYGAAANTPNTIFTATGAGTGTGTVTPTKFVSYWFQYAATLTIGNGSSQGSVALGTNPSMSSALTIQSGFFNNNQFSISFNAGGSFNYNNSNIKNIVINNTYPVTSTSLSDSNSWNGSATNTTVDFSNIILYAPTITGNVTLNLPPAVYGTINLYENFYANNKEIYISGTNITINALNGSQFVGDPGAKVLSFDANAVINIKKFDACRLFTITTVFRSGQVTLNKIGGNIVYFTQTRLQNINATPANTWYANTTSTSGLGGNALYNATNFGQNTDLGNNSGIAFNTYPALGNFNEFF